MVFTQKCSLILFKSQKIKLDPFPLIKNKECKCRFQKFSDFTGDVSHKPKKIRSLCCNVTSV